MFILDTRTLARECKIEVAETNIPNLVAINLTTVSDTEQCFHFYVDFKLLQYRRRVKELSSKNISKYKKDDRHRAIR